MGLEWVLMGLLVSVALWLGVDACRESKRLHARLAEMPVDGPLLADGQIIVSRGDWGYWPMTTAAAGDASIGPRM